MVVESVFCCLRACHRIHLIASHSPVPFFAQVGDCNNDSKTERKEYFCSCVDAASCMSVPEAAVLDHVVGSFNSCPVLVVSSRMYCFSCTSSLCSSMRSLTLYSMSSQIVSVSRIVWKDWHDFCGQQVVVPIEDIVGTVSKHPDRRIDGERVTRDMHHRLLVCLLGLVTSATIGILPPVETCLLSDGTDAGINTMRTQER